MRNIYYKPDGAWHLTQEEVAWINGAVEREAALRSQVEELTQEREQLKANLATRTFAANINSNAAKARKLDLQEAEAKLARIAELTTVYEADPINARDDPRSWQKLAALLAAAREPDNPADDPRVLLERISPDAAREQPTQEQPE